MSGSLSPTKKEGDAATLSPAANTHAIIDRDRIKHTACTAPAQDVTLPGRVLTESGKDWYYVDRDDDLTWQEIASAPLSFFQGVTTDESETNRERLALAAWWESDPAPVSLPEPGAHEKTCRQISAAVTVELGASFFEPPDPVLTLEQEIAQRIAEDAEEIAADPGAVERIRQAVTRKRHLAEECLAACRARFAVHGEREKIAAESMARLREAKDGRGVYVPPARPNDPVTTATADDLRDPILANNRDLRQLARECITALVKHNNPPRIFRRGTELVRVIDGAIERLAEYKMRHELARVAAFFERSSRGSETQCPPPIEAVRDVPAWGILPFPEIIAVSHGPAFDENGALLSEPGYHAQARIYIDRRVDVPTFQGTPQEAAAWICTELFADFPFASPADRANAMGALLSCVARPMIPGNVPGMGFEASIHGAGKGLAVDVITISAFGLPGAELASYSEQEEEMRKRITSSLRGAPGAIKVDNIRDRIDSSVLSSVLTTRDWSDRILGKSEIVTYQVRAVFFFTGNNPSLSGEIARRYVRIRLTPNTETPWTRDGFRHDNLIEWTSEHRGEILGAVARIIEGWTTAGQPRWTGRPLGSFESWSRVIGGILESCGVDGFMQNHAELFETADSDGEAWRELVDKWKATHYDASVTTKDLFSLATSIDGFSIEGKTEHGQRIAFGRALAKLNDRVFDSVRIIRVTGEMAHGAVKYRLQIGDGGESGSKGRKGSVPIDSHARDATGEIAENIELFPHGEGAQNTPKSPHTPLISPTVPEALTEIDLGTTASAGEDDDVDFI